MSGTKCYKLLNVLCPMHVIYGRSGEISFAGPTVKKIAPEGLIGRKFLEVFEIKRPVKITSIAALSERVGTKLNLRFRCNPARQLKGVVMEGPEVGQMTVNLSFGISVVDAVQDYNLTAADFAPTDLTVEMLYLVEAKSAAMEASRQLNLRLQSAREEAETQALTDTLTGLHNRRAMDQALAIALERGMSFALMHMDLDFFKAVNDTLGHAAGDHVLQEVARIMSQETRDTDIVARVGGDEFVILLQGTESRETIEQIGKRIIRRLQQPIHFEDELCQISASIGTVVAGDYVQPTPDQLLGDADAALYAAKHAGRGRHVFFSVDMRSAAQIA
ncbi:MAG: GGDEF domain-containing protein [Pseudomonadota bacterium]